MGSNSVLIEDNFDANLELIGMKKQPIANDGNCLFRAVSDQLYGHQDKHRELRKKTTGYLRAYPQQFISWIVPGSGSEGELRRSAHRAAKATISRGAAFFNSLSPEETDQIAKATYKQYVDGMCKDGKWAGEHEMQALANAMHINILIYTKKVRKCKSLDESIVECNVWHPLTKTVKIIRHEYGHFSSARPLYPQFGEWRGLKPQVGEWTQTRETAPIHEPNTASMTLAPQAPIIRMHGATKAPVSKTPLPTTNPKAAKPALPTPPRTPESNSSSSRNSRKISSSGALEKKSNTRFFTSELSSPARVTKAKPQSKAKTVIKAGEPKYMYAGEKSPMTRTAMRMRCGMFGKDEGKLFKRVEKNEDGTVKEYRSDQKITILKASV